MSAIPAPAIWVELVSRLNLPRQTYLRLQHLRDRESEGLLTEVEREELAALTEFSELLVRIRDQARQLLDRTASARRATRNGLPVILVPLGTPAIEPQAVREILEEEGF